MQQIDIQDAYPLKWPTGYPRAKRQRSSSFGAHSIGKCCTEVIRQIRLLGGNRVVISSNVPLNRDNLPKSGISKSKIGDPGVAVYFIRQNTQQVLACDTYENVEDNIWAIARTVEGLRTVGRYDVSDILNRTLTGLTLELPMLAQAINYWTILDMEPTKDKDAINSRYKQKARLVANDEALLRDLNTSRDLALAQAE